MSTTDPTRPGDDPGTGDGVTGPAGTGDPDAGRHAVQRPAPTPPTDPAPTPPRTGPTPVTTSPAGDERPAAPAGSTPPVTPGTPGTADDDHGTAGPRPSDDAGRRPADDPGPRASDDDELFPDPHAPRTPHLGSHVLGALVGLLLSLPAAGVLLLGQSRILVVQHDGWDASLELLGIVLVSAGALLLAALLALGLWSAAVPVTAGLVLGGVGGLQLYAPGIARAAALDIVGADAWDLTTTQVNVAGTSGTTITVGVLLLAGGVVIALARRHGVRLGAFRERNRAA
ncbi:hypothetical protein [Cellulomonas phragmiteti]|uniref:Uncharacterized protein n=1 Tax=Cellulomonas phragmiteti TaxID=478780 RepID=A0ABQ4DM97_9CELL|nr:hypothetical protein [Cellulomonas phragmiteti]GIG40471.1 hypothetical protein Cph01nite_22330 [Cellulomonas phragmiteti]